MTVAQGVRVVVFDLGGVVCRFRPDRRTAALTDATGLAADAVQASISSSGLDAAFDRGEFDLDGAVDAARNALGHRLDRGQLLTAWAAAFAVDEEVVAIAQALNCQAAILSNNGPLLEACCAQGIVNLRGAFDPIIFTWRLGAAKPDPESFNRAARRLERTPDQLVLIDDAPPNVRAATRSGWSALTYRTPQALTRALRKMGLC